MHAAVMFLGPRKQAFILLNGLKVKKRPASTAAGQARLRCVCASTSERNLSQLIEGAEAPKLFDGHRCDEQLLQLQLQFQLQLGVIEEECRGRMGIL